MSNSPAPASEHMASEHMASEHMASEHIASAPYKNAGLPAEERARDLLRRMTLPEKAAQMTCVWHEKDDTLLDDDGNFSFDQAETAFSDGRGIGQIGRPNDAGGRPSVPEEGQEEGQDARGMAEVTNAIQRFFALFGLIGGALIFLYPLTDKMMVTIEEDLTQRHAEAA